jgi:glycerol-3-phosphate dehydrogenase
MAKKWKHRSLSKKQIKKFCPLLRQDGLHNGIAYFDAQMDDCRFVLRLIRESVMAGGTALNYAGVTSLLRNADGKVCGVHVVDASEDDDTHGLDLQAKVVVNAAGPWSDEVRAGMSEGDKIRQLRGSHLIFSAAKLPLDHAITLYHPDDHRAMFALPWEGTTLIGTTDLDHPYAPGTPGNEPWGTTEEIDYMMRAIRHIFPDVTVSADDIVSSMAGLRPIISSGKENPSDESRAHAVWVEDGLVSIGGGKITIFRIMARDVMASVENLLGEVRLAKKGQRYFNRLPERLVMNDLECVDVATMNYLSGRYGLEISELVKGARLDECVPIESLPNVWAELRWTARAEAVVHLDDLLLRRVRLGLLLPNGAEAHMPRIRGILQSELGWSDECWESEYQRYRKIWQQAYAPHPTGMNERRSTHEQEE